MSSNQKKHLVVFSGAGISAESGIRTFRDSDGLWMGYDIYEVASPRGWKKNPELVLDFYNARRKDIKAAQPNSAHESLALMEENFQVTIITQNIDDLHERAGSSLVIHLHGEIFKKRSCLTESLIETEAGDIRLGDLAPDGGQWRPHIVWFEEPVPMIEEAARIAETADIFVVIGTSLQVYPAAGLVHCCREDIPVYVIDKNIPAISVNNNIITLETSATEGVRELLRLLD